MLLSEYLNNMQDVYKNIGQYTPQAESVTY